LMGVVSFFRLFISKSKRRNGKINFYSLLKNK
jgi:hypothetical protein